MTIFRHALLFKVSNLVCKVFQMHIVLKCNQKTTFNIWSQIGFSVTLERGHTERPKQPVHVFDEIADHEKEKTNTVSKALLETRDERVTSNVLYFYICTLITEHFLNEEANVFHAMFWTPWKQTQS